MTRTLIFMSLLLLACGNGAQPDTAMDTKHSTEGTVQAEVSVRIHPILHSAMELEWKKVVILVDPHDGAERYKSFPPADLILITDIHGDHMDTATLHGIDWSKARILVPQAVADLLPDDLRHQAAVIKNGEQMNVADVGIEAIPMYNMPDPNDPRHPKGRGNGYVLTLGKERVYISGDTEDIPEMRALKNIDVTFVCMNVPYTMTVDQAAAGVLAFKPRIVYPYHYRNKDGSLSDVKRFKELVNKGDPAIDVRLEDWYK